MRGIFLIVFFSLVLGLVNITINPNKPIFINEISFDEIANETFLLVDARSADDFELGHLHGALNLNEESFDSQIGDLLDEWTPDRKIGVYCNPLKCGSSAKIARRLTKDYGIEKVFVLKGDWRKWKK
jgi:Rhodanese-related sulfurtransferase